MTQPAMVFVLSKIYYTPLVFHYAAGSHDIVTSRAAIKPTHAAQRRRNIT